MLYQIPEHLPAFDVMLFDIGSPHPTALAARLGVDERTTRRWIKAGDAPRPVLLALFWLTRWGRSILDAEMTNRAAVLAHLSDSQGRELSRLRIAIQAFNCFTTITTTRPPASNSRLIRPRTCAPHTKMAPRLPQAPRLLHLVN